MALEDQLREMFGEFVTTDQEPDFYHIQPQTPKLYRT